VVVASAAVVSTAVVVSMGVSLVAVSAGEAFVAAVSTGVAFVVAVLVAATSVAIFAITDSLMMSSSATSAFRGGGAIRTDITVPAITRTITMGTVGTVTKATPVMDTAMAADQAFSEFVQAVTSARATAFRIRLVARAF